MATPKTSEDDDRKRFDRDNDRKDPAVYDSEHERLLVEKPFDFIQRTKPEDRLGEGLGQQTRDNVNPAIPSAPHGEGGIVDPISLGMPQASGGPAPQVESPKAAHPDMVEAHMHSPNEPVGSNIGGEAPTEPGGGEGTERPALVLKSIDPDTIPVQPEEIAEVTLTVTGDGFTSECVVLFDDEEVPTTFVSKTQLKAQVPVAPAVGTYDVEVALGEELSDVLTFEIVAAEDGPGTRSAKREPQKPKPKKSEPAAKRNKKTKRK